SWADGELDFAAARFHFFEGMGEIGETDLFGYEVVSQDVAAANGFERFANEPRRVMERGDELDLRIENGGGLDFHARARGQAAEEIHDSAAADHGQRLLPSGGIAGGLDYRIRAALLFGEISYGGHDIADLRDVDGSHGAHAAGNFQRGYATGQGYNAQTATREHADVFQANGTAANYNRGVAGAPFHLVNAAQDASQRLDQRSTAIVD